MRGKRYASATLSCLPFAHICLKFLDGGFPKIDFSYESHFEMHLPPIIIMQPSVRDIGSLSCKFSFVLCYTEWNSCFNYKHRQSYRCSEPRTAKLNTTALFSFNLSVAHWETPTYVGANPNIFFSILKTNPGINTTI